MWHTCTMEYYPPIKSGNPVICDNMDETGGHFAKGDKPGTERQILYGIPYMWKEKSHLPRNRE